MKKLVLLGGSVAVLRAMEILRDRNRFPEQVVMLLPETNTIADRARYVEGVIRQQKPRQLCYRPEDAIISGGIDIISDKTVTRVNVTRKKIHFDDRSQMDYDGLIIADTPAHKLDTVKGSNKEGVFGFVNPNHMNQIGTLAALNDSVTIQTDGWWGLDLALRLGQKAKDVILSVSGRHPLLRGTEPAFRDRLAAMLHERHISLLTDNGIEEILGDSDVKAVKTRSGKVYASQLVVLDDVRPDLRIFSEGVEFDADRIVVDERFRTNIPDVFAVDHVAQRSGRQWQAYGPQTDLLEYQGQVLADVLSEYEEMPERPVPRAAFGPEEFPVIAAGQLSEGRSVSCSLRADAAHGRLIKLFLKEERVIGALAVNTGLSAPELYACVDARRPLAEAWEAWSEAIPAETAGPSAEESTCGQGEEGAETAPASQDRQPVSAEE